MDFHNLRSLRRGVALFLAAAAPLPALAALGAGFVIPDLSTPWLLGATAITYAVWFGAIGWWLGSRLEAPLREWVEIADQIYMKQAWVDDLRFTDHKGALGKLARIGHISRDWLVDRGREAREHAAAAEAAEEARKVQANAVLVMAREQAQVVAALAAAMADVASGRPTARMEEAFPAEYQPMKDEFNAALETLQMTIQALKAGEAQRAREAEAARALIANSNAATASEPDEPPTTPAVAAGWRGFF